MNMTLVHVAGDVVTRVTCRWSRDAVTVRAALLQLMGGGWAAVGLGWAVPLLHCVNRSNRCWAGLGWAGLGWAGLAGLGWGNNKYSSSGPG